jgi:hypothetical protein
LEAQLNSKFKYGGPTSRSNSRCHLRTYKAPSKNNISIVDEPLVKSVHSYKIQNKIETHINKKNCDKQLLIDMTGIANQNPYQMAPTSDVDVFRSTLNTSFQKNDLSHSPSIFSARKEKQMLT